MNRIRDIRQAAKLDLPDAAAAAGMDVLDLAMAERGMGLVHFDAVATLASVLDVAPSALYPGEEEAMAALEGLADGDDEALELTAELASRLAAAGVDPDPGRWAACVSMSSGLELRYLLDSSERARLSRLLAGQPAEFICIYSDCRHVVLRASAVLEVRIGDASGCSRFSSRDSAMRLSFLRHGQARLEGVDAAPDEGGSSSFAAFLQGAQAGKLPAFLGFEDHQGDERFVGSAGVDLFEVPLGLVLPDLYLDEEFPAQEQEPTDLAEMEVKGHA